MLGPRLEWRGPIQLRLGVQVDHSPLVALGNCHVMHTGRRDAFEGVLAALARPFHIQDLGHDRGRSATERLTRLDREIGKTRHHKRGNRDRLSHEERREQGDGGRTHITVSSMQFFHDVADANRAGLHDARVDAAQVQSLVFG